MDRFVVTNFQEKHFCTHVKFRQNFFPSWKILSFLPFSRFLSISVRNPFMWCDTRTWSLTLLDKMGLLFSDYECLRLTFLNVTVLADFEFFMQSVSEAITTVSWFRFSEAWDKGKFLQIFLFWLDSRSQVWKHETLYDAKVIFDIRLIFYFFVSSI